MSNAVGSHVFYSIGLNKPHYLLKEVEMEFHNTAAPGSDAEKFQVDTLKSAHNDVTCYENIFGKYTEELTDEQK